MQRANEFAPQHSRLFKEVSRESGWSITRLTPTQMIIVTSPGKPFIYSGKMAPRRKAALEAYANEIEALYATVAESSQNDIEVPSEWSLLQTTEFVRKSVAGVFKESVANRDDLFLKGCDRYDAYRANDEDISPISPAYKQHGSETRSFVVCEKPSQRLQLAFIRRSFTTTLP